MADLDVLRTLEEKSTELASDLSLVNTDPLGAGWMFKMKVPAGTTLDHLLSKADYDKQIAGH